MNRSIEPNGPGGSSPAGAAVVGADVLQPEPLGQVVVEWTVPNCQSPADAVADNEVDLRPVERRLARLGRGGVLRAEDRLRGARLHRPRMAAGHRAARLQPAQALRAWSTSARTTPPSAGDDPPGAVRLDGALHGHPDRAFRRGVPALAGAGTGARVAGQRRFGDYGRKVEAELRPPASA